MCMALVPDTQTAAAREARDLSSRTLHETVAAAPYSATALTAVETRPIASNVIAPSQPNDAMRPRPFRVVHVHHETYDTFSVTLEAATPPHTLAFRPGQFNMLYAFGAGEVPISISGRPGNVDQVVHTVRAVG